MRQGKVRKGFREKGGIKDLGVKNGVKVRKSKKKWVKFNENDDHISRAEKKGGYAKKEAENVLQSGFIMTQYNVSLHRGRDA